MMTQKFAFAGIFSLYYLSFMPLAAQESKNAGNPNFVDRKKLPVPKEENQLFYLQRDPNTNTIVYTLNMKDGELVEKNPVHGYWIRYEDNGERAELSFLQRNMAYGISSKKTDNHTYELKLSACKKLPLYLHYEPNKEALVTIKTEEETTIKVDYIFVRIDGGSKLSPNIEYIEVGGINCTTKDYVKHRLNP
ncbi:DUF4833 domain-containing protein [Olivibacter sitiensis]|uniref:DUF4833 domain-containing protein n=1 Tax=Olivibacter sitiensis TaxID=376470 RepID=UPI000684B354|nr:DUF4833 domain-containing protein [Olivibacter sitiensis]